MDVPRHLFVFDSYIYPAHLYFADYLKGILDQLPFKISFSCNLCCKNSWFELEVIIEKIQEDSWFRIYLQRAHWFFENVYDEVSF